MGAPIFQTFNSYDTVLSTDVLFYKQLGSLVRWLYFPPHVPSCGAVDVFRCIYIYPPSSIQENILTNTHSLLSFT